MYTETNKVNKQLHASCVQTHTPREKHIPIQHEGIQMQLMQQQIQNKESD